MATTLITNLDVAHLLGLEYLGVDERVTDNFAEYYYEFKFNGVIFVIKEGSGYAEVLNQWQSKDEASRRIMVALGKTINI